MSTQQKKNRKLNRRDFLRGSAIAAGGAALAACGAQPTPEKVVETVIVEKEGETIVETVEVEKEVVKEVEKEVVITATPAPAEKVTVQVMRWGGTEGEIKNINEVLDRNPDLADRIDVEVLSPGNHDAEVYQYMRLALAAGTRMPDTILMNYIGVPEFASQDLLVDLGEETAPYLDDLLPGTKTLVTYKDKIIAVPRTIKTKVWYYRKDMFEEAGINVDEVKTFDDYMAAGRKLNETFPGSYIMNIGGQPIHYWYFMILMHWAEDEIRVANEDGSYNIAGNERYETLLSWLKTWKEEIAVPIDDWSPDWQPAFADSTIAGSLISQWMDWFLPGFAPEQAGLWGKTLWPEFNRKGAEAVGAVMVIPIQAQYPQEAFELNEARYLGTQAAVDSWKVDGAVLPMLKSAKDEIYSLIEAGYDKPADMSDEDWAVNPLNYFGPDYMDAHYEHEANYFQTFPYDPAASAELDILRKNTEAFIADEKTLEGALADAQSEMEQQIGNPYEV